MELITHFAHIVNLFSHKLILARDLIDFFILIGFIAGCILTNQRCL